MPVPARRVSSSHGRRRRSHDALKMTQVSTCPKCKEPALPHRACANCGTYKGRQILSVGKATEQLIEKSKAKVEPKVKKTTKKKASAEETPKN